MSSISAGRLALRLSTVKRAFAVAAPEAQLGIADLLITQDGLGFALNQNPLNVLILNQDIPEAQVGIADLLFTQDGQAFALNQNPLNVLSLNQDIADFSLVLSQDGDLLIDQNDRPFRTQQFISSS